MFLPYDRPSLARLFEARAALRRQEVLLRGAMLDVQTELREWQCHRRAQQAVGRPAPRDLCRLWEELAERERELALDLIQIRAAELETNREIQQHIAVRPMAS